MTRNIPENRALGYDLSPDGRELVFVDMKGLHLISIDTGAIRDIGLPGELQSHLWFASFFPDGRGILLLTRGSSGDELWATPATGGAPRQLRRNVGGYYAISPSGILFTSFPGDEIWFMGLHGENARMLLRGERRSFAGVAWSPGGQRIAYVHAETAAGTLWGGSIETLNLAGGDGRRVLSDPWLDARLGGGLAWDSDDRLIFVLKESRVDDSSESGNLWAIRTDPQTGKVSGRVERITNWSGIAPFLPRVSMDGRRLAVSKTHRWDNVYIGEIKHNGKGLDRLRRFTVSDSMDESCSWTPDSKAIVYVSNVTGQDQLFRKQIGRDSVQVLTDPDGSIVECAVTPDGHGILYSTQKRRGDFTFQTMNRVASTGGHAEQLFEFPSDGKSYWDCYSGSGGACVFGRLERGKRVIGFYSLDPQHGLAACGETQF